MRFTGERRIIAFGGLLSYVIGALQYQHLGPLPGAGTAELAELSDAEDPLLAETARSARRIAPEEEFRRGLTVLLHGLQHGLPPPDVAPRVAVVAEPSA